MPQIFEAKHLAAIDKLLTLTISGSWYLRLELKDYMVEAQIGELATRLEQIYEKGVKTQNSGRPFTPKYRFHRMVDADTHLPKIALQLMLPGNHFNQAEVAGEILLVVGFEAHGSLVLSLPVESPAAKLARENNWKATDAELEALTNLINAAQVLQALESKHFPVKVDLSREGVKIQTGYYNPMDQVRLALTR
jgi:hypothetical protein